MTGEELTIVYRLDTFEFSYALDGIKDVLAKNSVPQSGFKLFGNETTLDSAPLALRGAKRKTFNIVGQGFEFDLGCVRNSKLDFLQIINTAGAPIPWDQWIARYIGNKEFVFAWLANTDYQRWQNATDPLEYLAVNKPYAHLPRTTNGLPYPLGQTIIDISANPGRRLIRQGYYEVVGSTMWIGEPFWRLTGANKNTVISSSLVIATNSLSNTLRLQLCDKCFTSSEGELGKLQNKLRALLFPDKTAHANHSTRDAYVS